MATEKTINTRIQLKYSSLEEWSDLSVAGKGGNLILKAGEVGICAVPRGGSHLQTTPPAIMFKVGDGTTAFKDLPWASGLAADVYPWAKAPTPPTIGEGKITIKQAGAKKGEFTVNQTGDTTIELTDNNSDTNTQYKLELEGHKLILKSKEIDETTYNTVVSTITLPDNDTTYTFAEGDLDGTFTVTPKNGSAQSVKIKNVMTTAGGDFTGNITVLAPTANMHPATKQYVDTAIGKINSFEYVVVKGTLPTASKDTMYKIYLVADSTNKESQDNYDEYITVLTDTSTYTWEKIGNTTLDLSNYVNALSGTANSGVVTNISKSGNTISVTSKSLATSSPAPSGNATSFIDTISQEADGKIKATKKFIPTMTGATLSASGANGLVPAPASGDRTKFLRGDGTWAAVDEANRLATSRSIDGVQFDGSESIIHYGECDTGSNEVVKAVICTWFQPVTGARIAVKFNNNNLANDPQLNVNGTGPKPIHYRGSAIPSSYLAKNRLYEFIYNGTQYDLVGDINTDTGVTSVEFTGSGNAVTNATISGRKLSLTKGATFLTSHQDISGKQDKITSTNKLSASLVSGLATVATSGSYNDLADKPTIDNNNQKVKAGDVTFGANDTVNIVAGTNISVSGSAADKTITISGKSDDYINSLITTKINALDTTVSQPFMKSRTITKLTQKDGIIDAIVEDIKIGASQVTDFTTEVEKQINTHTGVDKVGTVTSVGISTTTNGGLKVSGSPVTSSGTINIDIDDSVVFVLNCGSATVNV